MAQSPDASWNPFGSLLTEYSFLVNIISLICLGLGLMFIVPIFFLIVMDLFLWIWRMYWNNAPAQTSDPKPSVTTDRTPTSSVATGIDKPLMRC